MAIIRCKMCGGNLEIAEGSPVGICDHCGAKQTLPRVDDEEQRNLFDRANELRMRSEFDKAETLYEKIIQTNPEEAEAYWGLILCRYGIEYVEEKSTGKRIPTCHYASNVAITADEDYKNALRYADISQKILYEEEAKAIDKIQKGILAISRKEEPYDVFICYKQGDEHRRRTLESVLSAEIYDRLTEQGYRVFFAEFTLKDRLGEEFEPLIFSALNSAKAMLCVGTKPENFQAVWVRNEWSRFLKLMKKDRTKMVIPCYKDMDPAKLPEEFAILQAQDMSRISFYDDLLRWMKKNVKKSETTQQARSNESVSPQVSTLLKRAFICLEDGEWEKANDLAEQVLNAHPENAEAYLVQLMARLCVNKVGDLAKQGERFDTCKEYQRIMRYGDDELKQTLQGYNKAVEERKRTEVNDSTLRKAYQLVENGNTPEDMYRAGEMLKEIRGWKNADELAAKASEKEATLRKDNTYNDGIKQMKAKSYPMAIEYFRRIPGWRDADELLVKCQEEKAALEREQQRQEAAILDATYEEAMRLLNSDDVDQLEAASHSFEALAGWRDSPNQLYFCRQKLEWAKANAIKQENERQRQYQAYCAGEQEKQRQLQSDLEYAENKIQKLSGQKAIGKLWKFITKCGAIFGILLLISSIISLVNTEPGSETFVAGIIVSVIVAIATFLCWIPTINAKNRLKQARKFENDRKEIKDEMAAASSPMSYEEFIRNNNKN